MTGAETLQSGLMGFRPTFIVNDLPHAAAKLLILRMLIHERQNANAIPDIA